MNEDESEFQLQPLLRILLSKELQKRLLIAQSQAVEDLNGHSISYEFKDVEA